jgi:ubiquinone/menaquinone biosynthesis C-methylase UbiE
VPEAARLAALGDEHAADGVEMARLVAAVVRHGGEEGDRDAHVADPVLATALELDACDLSCVVADRAGHEHLAASGHRGDTGGEVHRCPEPIAVALDCGTVVHPYADRRKAVAGHDLVRRGQSKRDRVGGIGVTDHHRISDGLENLTAAGVGGFGHGATEIGREIGSVRVSVSLGERRVARNVSEDEGPAIWLVGAHHWTVPSVGVTPTDDSFIPALRFHRLTPLFDFVAAVAVRDRTIKRRVLDRAGIDSGENVLDVGCGTGTLAVAAARAAPGVAVTGLDADASILSRAREKASDAGVEIRFDEGKSAALPYADASFDVVLSTLVFHHLPDDAKRQTAAELVRVLRPGGRLVVGDLGRPQDPFMRIAVRMTVQLLDGVTTTALNVRGELQDVLAGAGLRAVTVRDRVRTPTGSYEIITAEPSVRH